MFNIGTVIDLSRKALLARYVPSPLAGEGAKALQRIPTGEGISS